MSRSKYSHLTQPNCDSIVFWCFLQLWFSVFRWISQHLKILTCWFNEATEFLKQKNKGFPQKKYKTRILIFFHQIMLTCRKVTTVYTICITLASDSYHTHWLFPNLSINTGYFCFMPPDCSLFPDVQKLQSETNSNLKHFSSQELTFAPLCVPQWKFPLVSLHLVHVQLSCTKALP